jgi:hypothetical protein
MDGRKEGRAVGRREGQSLYRRKERRFGCMNIIRRMEGRKIAREGLSVLMYVGNIHTHIHTYIYIYIYIYIYAFCGW